MSRQRLLAAVRERMRAHTATRVAEEAAPAPPRPPRRPPEPLPDPELEQLEAEARYAKDRYDLYHARVVSGSSAPTSPSRLRELQRTAAAAADRLAHARRRRSH